MKRHRTTPRADWREATEALGLVFADSESDEIYWDESAFYEFGASEIDTIEAASNELQRLCLEAAAYVIEKDRFRDFGISPPVADVIRWAWDEEPPSIYGRFDLAFDGRGAPKLLEYNADTPTALLEAAVVQWYWLEGLHPSRDQFNSIHEKLVGKWRSLEEEFRGQRVTFAHLGHQAWEDAVTATYLRDTAEEAGLSTSDLLVSDIGWNGHAFVDLDGRPLEAVFKLYPWEWMLDEEFAPELLAAYRTVTWIEPIWKMLWSNKALLALLWELFPGHENLVPTYFDRPSSMTSFVRKPFLSREGANIELVIDGAITQTTDGPYRLSRVVYQQFVDLALFDGQTPILGSWMIDGISAGIGVRESATRITDNTSRFVPHLF